MRFVYLTLKSDVYGYKGNDDEKIVSFRCYSHAEKQSSVQFKYKKMYKKIFPLTEEAYNTINSLPFSEICKMNKKDFLLLIDLPEWAI